MITKGIPQEVKPSVLCNITTTFVRTSSTEQTIFKRAIDFSKIDYIFYSITGKLEGTGSGTGHIRVYYDTTELLDSQHPETSSNNNYGLLDVSSVVGKHNLIITVASGTDDLDVQGLYLGVVDV